MRGTLPASLPPSMPRLPSHWGRRLARWVVIRCGWSLRGEFPDVARLVLIAAPHSSWWDGFWGLLVKVAIGADVSFMAKHELFFWPLGWVLRKLGGIPVERSSTHGVVEQMVERLRTADRLWIGVAPEGTRKAVRKWRSGFWHIAHAAQVPILPVYFHYPEKTIGIGPLFEPSDDVEADLKRLRDFYAPWQGKHRATDQGSTG
jgi:1-acyl-sn-glycerol-3-phosphate acyltransferase